MKWLSGGIVDDHLRRACYYTNRGRLNATLFHDGDDFFTAVGGGGEAELVILASGQGEIVEKGGETDGSVPELRGKGQVRQADDTAHAGQLGDMPEIGQDAVADIDHGADQPRLGQGQADGRARGRVQQAGEENIYPIPTLTLPLKGRGL